MRARIGMALAVSVFASGCERAPHAAPARRTPTIYPPSATTAHEDSLALLRWTEGARYRQLIRAARKADDKRTAYEQTTCETHRLMDKLGDNGAVRAINESDFALMQSRNDSMAQAAMDGALRMQAINMLKPEQCDSIAKGWPALDTINDEYPGRIVFPPKY